MHDSVLDTEIVLLYRHQTSIHFPNCCPMSCSGDDEAYPSV